MGISEKGLPCKENSDSSGKTQFDCRDMSKCCSDSLHNGQSTKAVHQQRSLGSSSSRDSARMFLTGKSGKVQHYLRASTGSCHDICKYGHREEVRIPLRETWPRSSLKSLNSVETVVPGKPRMEKIVKHEPRADPRKRSLVISSKFKASSDAKTYSPRQNALNGGKTLLLNSTRNISSLLEPPASANVEVPSKGGCTDDKVSSINKHATDSSVKPKPLSAPYVGIQGKWQRHSSSKTGGKITASNIAAKKTSVHLSAPFPGKTGKLKLTSRKDSRRIPRIENGTPNNNDCDRTLCVIKTGTESNASTDANAIPTLSPSSSSPLSSSPVSESSSANTLHKIIASDIGPKQPLKYRDNTTPRKQQGSVSENIPPLKPFRTQKSVLPQPANNRARRLRFRTARILGPENGEDDAPDPGLPCLKVSLKHHEMQRKKETQGLFNNVIEETANKLVLSRKSKVKALVGAFEAVISLQEGKDAN